MPIEDFTLHAAKLSHGKIPHFNSSGRKKGKKWRIYCSDHYHICILIARHLFKAHPIAELSPFLDTNN